MMLALSASVELPVKVKFSFATANIQYVWKEWLTYSWIKQEENFKYEGYFTRHATPLTKQLITYRQLNPNEKIT
jgi:hypothetical protein